jgi:hypothetical protein
VDYAKILQDLRARHALIVESIAAIERMTGTRRVPCRRTEGKRATARASSPEGKRNRPAVRVR